MPDVTPNRLPATPAGSPRLRRRFIQRIHVAARPTLQIGRRAAHIGHMQSVPGDFLGRARGAGFAEGWLPPEETFASSGGVAREVVDGVVSQRFFLR